MPHLPLREEHSSASSDQETDLVGTPAEISDDEARRNFPVNVGSNVAYVVLNTVLMIWYVPFLLQQLGAPAYGMIALANSLVAFVAIITASLDTSINRYLAIDIAQNDELEAQGTFSAALILAIGIGFALTALAAPIVYYFPTLFQVPEGSERETQILVSSVIFTTITAIVSGVFGVSSVVKHRFDLRNLVRVAVSLSRVGIVWIAIFWIPATLTMVAIGFFVSALIGLCGDILTWKKLTPDLHFRLNRVSRTKINSMTTLSGWVAISVFGTLLLMQTDIIFINMYFGPAMTGQYGAVQLFPALVISMLQTVVSVLSPLIMARYARGQLDALRDVCTRSIKFIGIALALPIGLVSGFSRPLLTLWLGPGFAELDLLLIILTAHLALSLATRPLSYAINAYNRAREEALVTLLCGTVSVGLIYLAASHGANPSIVAAIAAVMFFLRNAVFLPAYSAQVVGAPWRTFFLPMAHGAATVLCVGVVSRVAAEIWLPASWLALGLAAGAISVCYIAATYFVSLTAEDRQLIWSLRSSRAK